ncbi:MAG: flagellar biosynthesis protein FlhF [Limnochordia bacterium]|jgi:flagellar biosynthesis protein FlhF
MKVKRFVGNSMQEAIAQLRATFGPDAVILHTKRFRQGPFGLIGRQKVEVIAAIDVPSKPARREQNRALQEVKEQLEEVKQLIKPRAEVGYPWADLYTQLITQDVSPENARDLIDKLAQELPRPTEPEEIKESFRRIIREQIKSVPPWELDQRLIVALVGPTGVGKTTTIAKLAANFGLLAKKRIGLITIDTYRIAAVDQLKTYGELMHVPVEVVFNEEELGRAVAKLADRDLILIDTAGRSQFNQHHLEETKVLLETIEPDEIHLVLSATTKLKDTEAIIDKFSILPIQRLIITKIDETSTYGMIYNAQRYLDKPLAYLTTGQNVPEDIEVAQPDKIASMILGEL